MRVRRIICRVLLSLLVGAVLVAGLLYGLADRTPADYREALQRVTRLTELNELAERDNREGPRRKFLELYGDFSKYGGAGEPFEFFITSDEVNMCLVSMDRIASLQSAKPVHATAKLEQAGFSDPMVAMDDGVLTLMVWSIEYGKVISADLSFIFDERGDMRLEILAIRIGVLPVPKSLLEGRIGQLREKLQNLLGRTGDNGNNLSSVAPTRDVARLLRAVASMLDGQAVRPKVPWRDLGAKHPLMITNVVITDGAMTLHFKPTSD
ncbi:MAG: hypothetical protein SVV80_07105 [Planctomycetota bacterium]|nr:hypothetical protein [Planctomycetota bacterium]